MYPRFQFQGDLFEQQGIHSPHLSVHAIRNNHRVGIVTLFPTEHLQQNRKQVQNTSNHWLARASYHVWGLPESRSPPVSLHAYRNETITLEHANKQQFLNRFQTKRDINKYLVLADELPSLAGKKSSIVEFATEEVQALLSPQWPNALARLERQNVSVPTKFSAVYTDTQPLTYRSYVDRHRPTSFSHTAAAHRRSEFVQECRVLLLKVTEAVRVIHASGRIHGNIHAASIFLEEQPDVSFIQGIALESRHTPYLVLHASHGQAYSLDAAKTDCRALAILFQEVCSADDLTYLFPCAASVQEQKRLLLQPTAEFLSLLNRSARLEPPSRTSWYNPYVLLRTLFGTTTTENELALEAALRRCCYGRPLLKLSVPWGGDRPPLIFTARPASPQTISLWNKIELYCDKQRLAAQLLPSTSRVRVAAAASAIRGLDPGSLCNTTRTNTEATTYTSGPSCLVPRTVSLQSCFSHPSRYLITPAPHGTLVDTSFAQVFLGVPLAKKTRLVRQLAFQLLFYVHSSSASLHTLEIAPAQCFFVLTPIQLFVWPSLLTVKQGGCTIGMQRGLVDVVRHVWLLANITFPIDELLDVYACGQIWRKMCSDYLREKHHISRTTDENKSVPSTLVLTQAEQEHREQAAQVFHSQQIAVHQAIYKQDVTQTLNELDHARRLQEQYLHEQRSVKLDKLNQNYRDMQRKIQSHRGKLQDLHWQQSQRRIRNRLVKKC